MKLELSKAGDNSSKFFKWVRVETAAQAFIMIGIYSFFLLGLCTCVSPDRECYRIVQVFVCRKALPRS